MSLLGELRDRLARHPSYTPATPGADQTASGNPAGAPFEGYDRMDSRKLMAQLHRYSQAELTAMDAYERGHQDRTEVLHKLRYMRGAEPLEGYDALSPDQIRAELANAELPTIKGVRDYERKFANRAEVVEAVATLHSQRLAERPPKVVPAYQAGGGSHASI